LEEAKKTNLDRLKENNTIGATSTNWLRDVSKVLNRRFDPQGRDRPLVLMSKGGINHDIWKPLLLWHMTRDEFLVRDFLITWLYPIFEKGVWQVHAEELHGYLKKLEKRKEAQVEHKWTETTLKRVAAGLLKIATDFDLMSGSVSRKFASYYLPEESFLYLLYALYEDLGSARKVLNSNEWRIYLMRSDDVERELLRLHQFRKLHYETVGSMARLELPCGSLKEYVETLVS
jgi:hypothetical protein